MKARFNGKCVECGEDIKVGKEIENEYKFKHIFDCINYDSICYNDDPRRYFC